MNRNFMFNVIKIVSYFCGSRFKGAGRVFFIKLEKFQLKSSIKLQNILYTKRKTDWE